ncbi:DUF6210 family protein [Aquimarina sp. 2201CG14-23]|uniref:DUF6210 family protein n=1 Tax=Aquimarina mycalae TaxID=3040073 RepID=UPI00247817B5|nr:DUF6210 family protein [Aquimarina sp. 2201CG14-23]MDH7447638.1 DUF6210 family protein [Aquimarina sp. 2201CG14-23]
MNKPLVAIWDTVGLGIVIEFPTGVLITNQTGGTACLHPKMEGVYVPFANYYKEASKEFLSPEIALIDYFKSAKYKGSGAIKGIDLEDVAIINEILTQFRLHKMITIDLEKLQESHEAWIYIKIRPDSDLGILNGFSEHVSKGVLTWSNSD